jgi:hypothetical protein
LEGPRNGLNSEARALLKEIFGSRLKVMNRLVRANEVVIGEAAGVPIGEDFGLMARGFLIGGLTIFPFPQSFLLAMVALQKFTSEKIRNGIANSFNIFKNT